METLLHLVLSNVGWAAALALGAAAVSLVFRQRPALVHSLWLLVLLKLVLPSPVQLAPSRVAWPEVIEGVAPRRPATVTGVPERSGRPTVAGATLPGSLVERVGETRAPRSRDRVVATPWPWRTAALVLWLAGASTWWSAVVLQAFRFRQLLLAARPADEVLRDRVGRMATRIGLRRVPAVWLVPARIPPMLWALTGPPKLILPEDLWGRIDQPQQDTVLAHELAHLKRRDHWVRWLEAVVLGLYWWNPIAWWARRQVEKAEEQCCDAWVVWALPEAAEAYAETLVATAVFLSGSPTSSPLGATGVGRIPPLRRRLDMILRDPAAGSRRRPAPGMALIIGGLSLLLLPAWVPGNPADSPQSRPGASTEISASSGADGKAKAGDDKAAIQEVDGGPGPGRGVADPAVAPGEVAVSQPLLRDVRDYEDFTGRVEAVQTIELRARVTGTLNRVPAPAETVVKKGDLLFEIDPRPYQAEVEKAEAEVRRAEIRRKRHSDELRATNELKSKGIIGQNEFNRIESERDEAEAALEATIAARDLARIKLDSAKVTAPIDGKISRSRVSAGSLVIADTTVLATIDSSDPMAVSFDMDERTVLRLGHKAREAKAKVKSGLNPSLEVLVGLADEEAFPHRGVVDSLGTKLDPSTGTLRCHAVLTNPDAILLPGLFARVRLITSPPYKALLVAEGAVRTDQSRRSVFVVSDRDVVERRTVRLGLPHGGLRVVTEGLKEGEWVVVNGGESIQAGMTVKPAKVAMPTSSSTPRGAREE